MDCHDLPPAASASGAASLPLAGSGATSQPLAVSGATSQRGVVLVMAMLMTATLSALGSAAVMRSSFHLRDGGAQRIQRAAYRLSEAGTMGVLSLAAQQQSGFLSIVQNSGLADPAKGIIGAFDNTVLGSSLVQVPSPKVGGIKVDPTAPSVTTSFGAELAVMGASFQSVVYEPDLTSQVAGYEAGQYCFNNFRVVTTATIGNGKAGAAHEELSSGEAAIAAQIAVGPVPCGTR